MVWEIVIRPTKQNIIDNIDDNVDVVLEDNVYFVNYLFSLIRFFTVIDNLAIIYVFLNLYIKEDTNFWNDLNVVILVKIIENNHILNVFLHLNTLVDTSFNNDVVVFLKIEVINIIVLNTDYNVVYVLYNIIKENLVNIKIVNHLWVIVPNVVVNVLIVHQKVDWKMKDVV